MAGNVPANSGCWSCRHIFFESSKIQFTPRQPIITWDRQLSFRPVLCKHAPGASLATHCTSVEPTEGVGRTNRATSPCETWRALAPRRCMWGRLADVQDARPRTAVCCHASMRRTGTVYALLHNSTLVKLLLLCIRTTHLPPGAPSSTRRHQSRRTKQNETGAPHPTGTCEGPERV